MMMNLNIIGDDDGDDDNGDNNDDFIFLLQNCAVPDQCVNDHMSPFPFSTHMQVFPVSHISDRFT